jgi:hypothetical protein
MHITPKHQGTERTQNVEACCRKARVISCTRLRIFMIISKDRHDASCSSMYSAWAQYQYATLHCSRVVRYESYIMPIWRLRARLPTSPHRLFFCAALYHDDDQRTTLARITSTYQPDSETPPSRLASSYFSLQSHGVLTLPLTCITVPDFETRSVTSTALRIHIILSRFSILKLGSSRRLNCCR